MSNVVVTKDAIKNASLEYIISQRYQLNSNIQHTISDISSLCWEKYAEDEKMFFLNMSLIERELKYKVYDVFYMSLSKSEQILLKEYFKNKSSFEKISFMIAISPSQLVKVKNKLIAEYKDLLQFNFLPSMLFDLRFMANIAGVLEEYVSVIDAYKEKGMVFSDGWLEYIYSSFRKVTKIISNAQKITHSHVEIPFFHKILVVKQRNPRMQIQEISSICGVPGFYVSKTINYYKNFVMSQEDVKIKSGQQN